MEDRRTELERSYDRWATSPYRGICEDDEHTWDIPGYECECGDGNCLVVCLECDLESRACDE